VHVVDASDPAHDRQLAVTAEVLADIGAADVPRLLVLNKIDKVADEAEATARLAKQHPDAIIMSARNPGDVAHLHKTLVDFFSRQLVEEELRVPYDRQELRGQIFEHCQVLEERYEEGAVVFRVRADPAHLARLRAA
jgi:GTP-binding protein HflX